MPLAHGLGSVLQARCGVNRPSMNIWVGALPLIARRGVVQVLLILCLSQVIGRRSRPYVVENLQTIKFAHRLTDGGSIVTTNELSGL